VRIGAAARLKRLELFAVHAWIEAGGIELDRQISADFAAKQPEGFRRTCTSARRLGKISRRLARRLSLVCCRLRSKYEELEAQI